MYPWRSWMHFKANIGDEREEEAKNRKSDILFERCC